MTTTGTTPKVERTTTGVGITGVAVTATTLTGTEPRTEVRVNAGTGTTTPGQLPTGPKGTRARLEGTGIHEVKVIHALARSVITSTAERREATRPEEGKAPVAEGFMVAAVSTAVVARIANKS